MIIFYFSAGVGRTGTFIVIDAVLQQVKNEGMLDIYGFVAHVRKQRNFMVQTEVSLSSNKYHDSLFIICKPASGPMIPLILVKSLCSQSCHI